MASSLSKTELTLFLFEQLRKAPKMTTIVDLLRAEGKAEGIAIGKIEGEARLLRYLVAKDQMTLEKAMANLVQMAKEREWAGELERAAALSKTNGRLRFSCFFEEFDGRH